MTEKLPGDAEGRAEPLGPIVERARAGDAAAFEQLMIYTQQRVVRTAWRMLGDREDARDAAQEVYLRAFKYLGRFRAGEDFQAWLYRITINVCRDLARKREGRRGVRVSSLEGEWARAAQDYAGAEEEAAEAAVLAQRRALVARAIETLPEKERAAIVLRDLEGLSTEEVARALGSSPATVRSQISTARAKIRLYCERLLRRGR